MDNPIVRPLCGEALVGRGRGGGNEDSSTGMRSKAVDGGFCKHHAHPTGQKLQKDVYAIPFAARIATRAKLAYDIR